MTLPDINLSSPNQIISPIPLQNLMSPIVKAIRDHTLGAIGEQNPLGDADYTHLEGLKTVKISTTYCVVKIIKLTLNMVYKRHS